MPTLYIVATPIGNLDDISFRAIKTLKEVDLILCEDTRRTRKLLNHYEITKKTVSYHQHSKLKKINYIIDLLKQGKDLALVSDAGTPGISDPGNKLIEKLVELFGDNINIIPIPGASAITAAASISGFSMDKFLFLGFPPAKKKRTKFFEEVLISKRPVVFFESPYRILRTLNDLKALGAESVEIVLCRELTKKFEITYRGTVDEVEKELKKDKIRGEFVVIVNKEYVKR